MIAFEPASDSADKPRRAAALNHLPIWVVPAGLGREEGEVTLFTDVRYEEHDAGVRSQFGTGSVVECVSVLAFDAWADEHHVGRVDVIKIDVEGAEPRVVAGTHRCLSATRPRAVLIEVKDSTSDRDGWTAASLRHQLATLRYEDHGLDLNHNRLFRPNN